MNAIGPAEPLSKVFYLKSSKHFNTTLMPKGQLNSFQTIFQLLFNDLFHALVHKEKEK